MVYQRKECFFYIYIYMKGPGNTDLSDEDTCPEFKFRIVANFEDCLSRKVTEAVMIHYSPDILIQERV